MKRKLISILLALALCLPLAGSAFAEGEAETPAPGEQTETLPVETETRAPEDAADPEEEAPPADKPALEKKEEAAVEEDVWVCGHFHCVEEVVEEDGTTWRMGYLCCDASCQYLQGLQTANVLSATAGGLLPDCTVCGRSDWGPEVPVKTFYYDTGDPATHEEQKTLARFCQTAGCDGCATRLKPREVVAHSWSQTGTDSNSDNGSTHTVTYTYTCVCGHTKTEPESEEHTLKNMGYSGSNYHSGRLHYVGYQHVCEKCGYTTVKYESTPCPGNNNGVGCQFFINGVNPPIEIQDVTEPEAEAAPEGKVPSEDVIYTWDSEFPDYSDGNFISWTWTEMETEEGVKALHLCLMPIEDPAKIDVVSTIPANEGAVCITHLGIPEVIGQEYKNKGTNHEVYDVIQVKCGACGEEIIRKKLTGEEDHSWTKGGPTGNYSSNSLTHAAEYTYTCVCEATKTEVDTESEEHSLEKIGYTGNNYHRGRLHYVEYRYTCKTCGYTMTKCDTCVCPGNTNGVGCTFPINGVKPPVEAQDVTEPEEGETPAIYEVDRCIEEEIDELFLMLEQFRQMRCAEDSAGDEIAPAEEPAPPGDVT